MDLTWLIRNRSFVSDVKRTKIGYAIPLQLIPILPFLGRLVIYLIPTTFYFLLFNFTFSGTPPAKAYCGGYSPAGTLSYADALLIPMASTVNMAPLVNGNFCGQGSSFVGTVAGGAAMAYPQVCCK